MKSIESYHISKDHHRLYYKVYKPANPKAVLIFVHGLNEHSGRYQNPIRYFYQKGYTLYLFDHRGHGKSDGLRSFVDTFDSYAKDLNDFTQYLAKKEKGQKIFMVGHSMGGQIVLNYLGHYKTPLAGVMTSSANIQMALKVPYLKKKLGLWLSSFLPKLGLPNEIDPKWISRDDVVVKEYKQDPLVSKKITLKLASEIIKNQESIMALASKITLPIFLMHGGDDQICAAQGSIDFYERLASPDKQLKIYDHFYHEIFNEIGKEQVFHDMEDWLTKRLTAKKPKL